ncbi:hypothetical protein QQZ08_005279 [Neonectria magnoliae]|uniref:Uncharacterized protein n=1 Tax=Neonectria magnoliae TaxID=2732573 RepID=A0ABR1I3V0_9HYPO
MAAPSIAQPGGSNCTPVFAGIDFGTTFSGLAYAIGGSRENPQLVNWGPVNSGSKFPSKVTSSNNIILCGPQIPEGTEAMEWFKLALLHHDDLDSVIRESALVKEYQSFRRRLKFKASEVVQHLLKYMWGKFKDTLQSSNPEKAFLFHLTVAVPANWPQYTFTAIRKAVEKSGIGPELHAPVSFVSEPEATILATIAAPATLILGRCLHPELTFTLEDLTPVFEPVFQIAQLVEEQIHAIRQETKKAPTVWLHAFCFNTCTMLTLSALEKYIIISGGFGSNKYVRSIIHNRVNEVSQRIGYRMRVVVLPGRRR